MKATELRIGNWAMYSSKIQVNENKIRECVDHPDRFAPIPLTEEWLERFGFEDVDDTFILEVVGVGGFKMAYRDDFSCTIAYKMDLGITPSRKTLSHVHQLQNLYHALTGEELNQNKDDIK